MLAKLPIDLGQGQFRHTTKAKLIAFNYVPKNTAAPTSLDVGCGDGYWSEKLKSIGYKTTSVDMNREYPNVDWETPYKDTVFIDLNKKLPFQDASFDLVWCSEVIEHLNNPKEVIKEIERVVKPGGKYILTTPNSFFWLYYFLKLFGFSHKDWQNAGHKHFFHMRDIRKLFPQSSIYGYFPYIIFKFKIKRFVSLLSPNFIIVGKKQNG
jgi:2-polyprenyl-3-methyl-5-hydroxy-6-metoxy-1,4-benzoquinol methylase